MALHSIGSIAAVPIVQKSPASSGRSIGVIELNQLLGRTFAIEIPEADLFSPEFSTIDGNASIVVRNRSSQSRAPRAGAILPPT
jgi:hypothetical protein